MYQCFFWYWHVPEPDSQIVMLKFF